MLSLITFLSVFRTKFLYYRIGTLISSPSNSTLPNPTISCIDKSNLTGNPTTIPEIKSCFASVTSKTPSFTYWYTYQHRWLSSMRSLFSQILRGKHNQEREGAENNIHKHTRTHIQTHTSWLGLALIEFHICYSWKWWYHVRVIPHPPSFPLFTKVESSVITLPCLSRQRFSR